jgi:1-phosphofructokinase family hexose kinase
LILTVTLNAAIDRTYRIDGFSLDVVHRPSACWIVAGGKGINVARVVTRLGGQAFATGFLGGHNGQFIADSLQEEGIPGEFVTVEGESRTCIAAVDHLRKSQTEINEVGPTIRPDELKAFVGLYERLVVGLEPRFVVLCGSLPMGVPDATYRMLIEAAHRAGVPCVLDASGQALREGAGAKPWMIKPNSAELEQLCGRRADTPTDVAELAASVVAGGVEIVVATMGARGCVCVTARDRFWVASPEVPFVSAVGSGDAFVASFLVMMERGATVRESCRYGVAAGADNACRYGAGFVERAEVERLAATATVQDL